jgi:hypothetical protein
MKRPFKFGTHRGQLQIAETLIAVSLMLVLALLLISASQQITPPTNLSYLDQEATDILASADEVGLLRPVIYLYGNNDADYQLYQDMLEDYFSAMLSANIGFTLIAHEILNDTISSNYFTVIGSPANIGALQEGGKAVIANYFLGSFNSAKFGLFPTKYLVQLYLWEMI